MPPTRFVAPLLTAAISALTAACTCSNADRPPEEPLTLFVRDTRGQGIISYVAGRISPDSVRVTVGGNPAAVLKQLVNPTTGEHLLQVLPQSAIFPSQGDVRAYLYLSRTDTDTLDISYHIRKDKCFEWLEFDGVRYNGRLAQRNADQTSAWVGEKR